MCAPRLVGAQAAQSAHEWVIVPTTTGDDTAWMTASIEAVRAELKAQGKLAWSPEAAADRFEMAGSAPAPALSSSDIERWVARSRAAVRHLARADYRAARRELKSAAAVADRAAAELNREAARARQVLDTCLYMVRALIETDNLAKARQQARECRLLVPRVEPSAYRHTPEVNELLERVDTELEREAPGQLTVQSEPPKCLVRINGIEFGQTPVSHIDLPVGTYRLQVECGQSRGRVRKVVVTAGNTHVFVDTRFEEALRSRPLLYLRYASEADSDHYRAFDADHIARTLGSGRFVLLSHEAPGVLRIDRAGRGQRPASVWLPTEQGKPNTNDLVRGMTALFSGRSVDFTGAQEQARAPWSPPKSAPKPPSKSQAKSSARRSSAPRGPRTLPPKSHRIAGYTLLGAGGAVYFTSVGLHFRRNSLGDDFIASPSSRVRAQSWKDARIGTWLTAGLGGGTLTAALPLVLPHEPSMPWWAWVSGAAGVGLAAYGIFEAATLTGCNEATFIGNATEVRACVARGKEADRAMLAGSAAAPLLTMPLVYWLRPKRPVSASITIRRHAGFVQVGGLF